MDIILSPRPRNSEGSFTRWNPRWLHMELSRDFREITTKITDNSINMFTLFKVKCRIRKNHFIVIVINLAMKGLCDDDFLSVCLSPVVHMWGSYEHYQINQNENLRHCWDHDSRLPDAVIWRHSNPKWRTATDMKIALSACMYLSE